MEKENFLQNFKKLCRSIITEDKLEDDRLSPDPETEKRDAVSDLLLGYMTQKQIDDFDYKKGLNTVEIQKGLLDPKDLTKSETK